MEIKKSVTIGGRPIAMTDAQIRQLLAMGKRKPSLKRAADKAWAKKAKP